MRHVLSNSLGVILTSLVLLSTTTPSSSWTTRQNRAGPLREIQFVYPKVASGEEEALVISYPEKISKKDFQRKYADANFEDISKTFSGFKTEDPKPGYFMGVHVGGSSVSQNFVIPTSDPDFARSYFRAIVQTQEYTRMDLKKLEPYFLAPKDKLSAEIVKIFEEVTEK